MKQCEYPDGEPIGRTRSLILLEMGLELRAIVFYSDHDDPLKALQLNCGDLVLWRRWLDG